MKVTRANLKLSRELNTEPQRGKFSNIAHEPANESGVHYLSAKSSVFMKRGYTSSP